MKYVKTDTVGRAIAFYSDDVSSNIPAGAFKITNEQWQELLSGGDRKRFIDGVVVDAPPVAKTLAEAREEKFAALAAKRFAVETAGVTVGETTIRTDRESQATITGAWVRVQQDPEVLIDWKGADGWVQIGKSQVEAIAAVVGAYVQSCFSAEKAHYDNLMALTSVDQVNGYNIHAGWPAA